MNRVITYSCAFLLGLGILASPVYPQDSPPKKVASVEQIFSGTLTKLTDDSLTVVRKTLGHAAVTKDFSRNGETQVEGVLREGVRVTVRYRMGEDGGLIAVHIIVR